MVYPMLMAQFMLELRKDDCPHFDLNFCLMMQRLYFPINQGTAFQLGKRKLMGYISPWTVRCATLTIKRELGFSWHWSAWDSNKFRFHIVTRFGSFRGRCNAQDANFLYAHLVRIECYHCIPYLLLFLAFILCYLSYMLSISVKHLPWCNVAFFFFLKFGKADHSINNFDMNTSKKKSKKKIQFLKTTKRVLLKWVQTTWLEWSAI